MKTYEERAALVAEKLCRKRKEQKKMRATVSKLSAVTAVVLLVGLLLFYPYPNTPPSVDRYADSPYYNVIQKINVLNYRPPEYANNFERFWGEYVVPKRGEQAGPPSSPNQSGVLTVIKPTYEEVTDNQVAGVIEADIFKRSDKHIYHLKGTELRVYEIAGEDSKEVGSYTVGSFDGKFDETATYYGTSEMYLSQDCTTVTLLMHGSTKALGYMTVVMNLDVTDPQNIREMDYVCIRGSLTSSRMVDGKLLLVCNYYSYSADFDRPETFIPGYGKPNNMELLKAEDILCPDTATKSDYTVLAKVDGQTLEVEGIKALLSYTGEVYVSSNAIYAIQTYAEKTNKGLNQRTSTAMTKVTGISYSHGLEVLGTVTLEGNIRNQYFMDEYEGILRVVTNTNVTTYREEYGQYDSISASLGERVRNVNLYCIDLGNWEAVSSVLGFAPEGEQAESVRFDGKMGYVCTAEVITLSDPVYYFDLSDPGNITWTDTGTIDGYSTSLIQLTDGFLVGVGLGDRTQTKIEVYRETEDSVISVAVWEADAGFSREYKSYFIDREKGLIGLALDGWKQSGSEYVLLQFDGNALTEVLRVRIEDTYMEDVRACLIDGYFYILDNRGLTVEKLRY